MSNISIVTEGLLTFLGFRALDASNLSFFQKLKKEFPKNNIKCLPLINSNTNTITYATFQKHFKFAIHVSKAPRDERETYQLMILCLIKFYDIDRELFQNGARIVNSGMLEFPHTEHQTCIRLWCSKKIGKNVVYELTVSSYKGAVPEPMKSDPSKTKNIILK